jgi:hypothetical protein
MISVNLVQKMLNKNQIVPRNVFLTFTFGYKFESFSNSKSVMKKLFVFFAFTLVVGLTSAAAQSCSGAKAASATGKSCCANKAAKAAMGDASIEKRANEDGTVSYVRKEADAQGNVRFVAVSYDETANAFVNVAPATTVEKKSCASGTAGMGKACCASKSATEKACCAGKTKAASCEKKESKVEN